MPFRTRATSPSRPSTSSRRWHQAAPWALAALFLTTGATHFAHPRPFAEIVPSPLGEPYRWVYASGVAELACAVGLAVPTTRRAAAWASAVLFVVVFPGNVQMALDAGHGSAAYRAVVYGRLPLQLPLVLTAVGVARRAARRSAQPAP